MANPSSTQTTEVPKFVGKYKIIRMIARSNDIVYEAVDPNLGRHVALKELQLSSNLTGVAKRERIERFSREAKAAGALKHPNIVTIYEVGQHLEHRFIAMEYLEGQTLRDAINVQGPFAINDAVQIALQLCDALGYAHQQGVVHRDVKPDNIHLVPPNRMVKLTDFGIARMLTEPSITATGQVFGTPSYMSPEQLTARAVDHRTDIFSTAVVLYEMIVGKKPFRGDSIVAITYQIMNAEPQVPATVPPNIATILLKALAKDPDHRYQNMRSLTMDLRREMASMDAQNYANSAQRQRPQDQGQSQQPVHPQYQRPQQGALQTQPQQMPMQPGAINQAANVPTRPNAVVTMPNPQYSTAPFNQSTAPPNQTMTDRPQHPDYQKALSTVIASVIAITIGLILTLASGWFLIQHIIDGQKRETALKSYKVAIDAAASGDMPTAITKYQEAVDAAPRGDVLFERATRGLSDCYVSMAIHSQMGGKLDDAEGSYNSALATDPSNPIAHFDLGALYEAKNDPLNAMQQYVEVHTLDPTSDAGVAARQKASGGYYDLGSQAFNQGDAAQARQDWQNVINIDPSSQLADQARQRLSQLP